jgi:hypothetical protein
MNVDNKVYEISKMINEEKERQEELARRALLVALNSKYGKFAK